MKEIISFIGIAIAVLCCSPNKNRKPLFHLIVGVDRSDSQDSLVKESYKKTIENFILPNLGPHSKMTVIPIDQNSLTVGDELFLIDFSKNNYSNTYAGLQEEQLKAKSHHDSILTAITSFRTSYPLSISQRRKFQKGTDIFGVIKRAKTYANPNWINVLILLSDMQQYTSKRTMNFEDSLTSPSDVDRYITMTDSIDLSQLSVFVITGAQPTMTAKKFQILELFWRTYFSRSNAQVIDYSSGNISKLEEMLLNLQN